MENYTLLCNEHITRFLLFLFFITLAILIYCIHLILVNDGRDGVADAKFNDNKVYVKQS